MDSKYQLIEKIGEGGFGVVYKCREHATNKTVAMKRIIFIDQDEGVPSSVIREISLLQELNHGNIIRLLEVINNWAGVDLIFEYLDLDLSKFIASYPEVVKDRQKIKGFLSQILCGVAYCHSHKILHRDLKPENLLIDGNNSAVKIADFGLARAFGVPLRNYTGKVATLAYKAPELLLGANYSTPVDMWSVGCIFAEMVTGQPLFQAQSEFNVLMEIFRMFGVPTEATWPGVTSLYVYITKMIAFPTIVTRNLATEAAGVGAVGLDLLSKMLILDPSRRITASDALQHAYFRN
ncbi:cell division control protein 2 homolog 1-like [Cornus florida]|uniref:cell division control protein 2 homolog 1-like n=1 Tax=Cornus florida TaxID=4283 RepID=UPI002897A038|nr:cell division control protein 2 homolog 1-like [Cornus florida]XP_059649734.1 cell division control protein 2 homolog 1-like [Cornus florida]XP_059649735.1 cell division control protein 2 homolog 1-like [Cornus florida]XP_059649737.1 cell division control protein 2 homolog 1-like [Cornus florida]XP_059649738.1 cell division control protein 2 homolog 1-like [Cornus florida]